MDPVKLRQQRAKLIEDARKILLTAEKEEREINSDEETHYENIMADVDKLAENIKREESLRSLESEMSAPIAQPKGLEASAEKREKPAHPTGTQEYRSTYDRYLRRGFGNLSGDERRALEVGTNSEGGFTVADEFNNTLIEALEQENVMRRLGSVMQTGSGTHKIATVSTKVSAAWTDEEAAFNESTPVFAQKTLSAYKATILTKISDELLADSMFDLDGYLRREFVRGILDLEETAFVNGDGSSKPQGAVQGSTAGKSFAGAAAITAAETIDLFHALKPQYRRKATWLMHDDAVKLIRKLTEAVNGQFLWQPGLQAGQPDTLLGRPVEISSDMPQPTTGNKSVLFGDFSYYWIADRGPLAIKRLDELYSTTGQVGFIGYKRTDGVLTLAEAIQHGVQA